MVRDRTVVIGHLIGLLRALSVLISFSFHLLEQKKILGLTQRQRCFFFEISPCNVFSANICLVTTVKGSMSSTKLRSKRMRY